MLGVFVDKIVLLDSISLSFVVCCLSATVTKEAGTKYWHWHAPYDRQTTVLQYI